MVSLFSEIQCLWSMLGASDFWQLKTPGSHQHQSCTPDLLTFPEGPSTQYLAVSLNWASCLIPFGVPERSRLWVLRPFMGCPQSGCQFIDPRNALSSFQGLRAHQPSNWRQSPRMQHWTLANKKVPRVSFATETTQDGKN